MKFALTDKDGNRAVYTLKPFDKLTLSDYAKFHCEPWPEGIEGYEHAVEYLSRMTGAPKKKLLKVPVKDFELLQVQAFDAVGKISEAQQKEPGTTFTHRKQTFTIPHDLEDIPFQQWRAMVDIYWPRCTGEADAFATSLACFCLKEGEDFDDVDVEQRKALFMDLPCSTALGTCAFFFARSQRFRDGLTPCLSTLTRSRLLSIAQGLPSTLPATAAS